MKKVSFIIALCMTLFIGLATIQNGEFENIGSLSVFLLIELLFIYLFVRGTIGFFHKIGKNAAKITREEGAKYKKIIGADYIRELPSYYTPALVSFVQDSAIEYNKDVLATILYLINNEYLKIENDKLIAIEKNIDNLYEHEKYIYNVIYHNLQPSFSVFKDRLIKDSYNLDLVKKANNSKFVQKGIFKLFFGRVWYPIIIVFLFPFLPLLGTFGFVIIFFLMFSIPFIMFSRFGKGISYLVAAGTRKVELNEKGKKDQEKIYMFKNFLKEFTSLNSKDVKDIHLWDEYLIYALVLGVNKKIYEDDKLRDIVNKVQKIIVSDYKNDMLS